MNCELPNRRFGYDAPVPTRRKQGRGGARPGAGRKPTLTDRVGLSVQFDGDIYDRLAEAADESAVSMGSVVREAVAQYLARKRKK